LLVNVLDCELIARLATDKEMRETFGRIAKRLREMATELDQQVSARFALIPNGARDSLDVDDPQSQTRPYYQVAASAGSHLSVTRWFMGEINKRLVAASAGRILL
jgi:hypothetical protein